MGLISTNWNPDFSVDDRAWDLAHDAAAGTTKDTHIEGKSPKGKITGVTNLTHGQATIPCNAHPTVGKKVSTHPVARRS